MRNEYHDVKGWKTWYESIEPTESEDSLLKQINPAGVRTEKQAPLEAEAKGRFDFVSPVPPEKDIDEVRRHRELEQGQRRRSLGSCMGTLRSGVKRWQESGW